MITKNEVMIVKRENFRAIFIASGNKIYGKAAKWSRPSMDVISHLQCGGTTLTGAGSC